MVFVAFDRTHVSYMKTKQNQFLYYVFMALTRENVCLTALSPSLELPPSRFSVPEHQNITRNKNVPRTKTDFVPKALFVFRNS